MCANSEGSVEIARMRRLAWAFAGQLCYKYHNLMSGLICVVNFSTVIISRGERERERERERARAGCRAFFIICNVYNVCLYLFSLYLGAMGGYDLWFWRIPHIIYTLFAVNKLMFVYYNRQMDSQLTNWIRPFCKAWSLHLAFNITVSWSARDVTRQLVGCFCFTQ